MTGRSLSRDIASIDLLGEGFAHRADADDRRRLDSFDGGDEIPGRRVRMGVGLLEVEQVRAARLEQAVDVEHVRSAPGPPRAQALLHHGGDDQVGEADAGRTGAEEQDALVAELAALDAAAR